MPLIATNCIVNDRLYPVHEKVRYVSEKTYDTWFRGHPEPGDVIFVCKGSPGNVALAPDPVGFCIAQDMVAVRADPQAVYPKFLFAALRSPLVQTEIANLHVGTLIPHFKKGDFDKLLIPLPDRSTQVFIGDFYFELSSKAEVNSRTAELCGLLAAALFSDSATHDVRLSDVADAIMGQSPPGSTYNEERVGLPFYQGRRDFGYRFPSERIWCSAPTRIAERHDVLLSVRAPVGALNVTRDRCAIGRGVAAIRSEAFPSTVFHSLNSDSSVWAPFEHEGTLFGSIGKSQVNELSLKWPTGDAGELETVLAALDAMVAALETETDRLTAIRDTLLVKLLAGDLQVDHDLAQEAV
jgi:type I restriction enzyme S subunit